MNSHDPFYRALLARDHRFDGKFFVAVKTTGIYCRPICPARPKRENVLFFKTAQAAEQAGYRPCLRCRPESAPGSPAWNGKQATVERALKLLAQGVLEQHSEEVLADRLGVSARHLRRLFEKELGQTPKQLHDGSRLNFARKLIVETPLPFTEIAFSTGFRSLRRFNDAVKKRFHRPPSALRSSTKGVEAASMIRLGLAYRPPFDWRSLLDYYRRHHVAGIEAIEGDAYSRVFTVDGVETTGYFRIRPDGRNPELALEICLSDTRCLLRVVQRIRHMFDLDSDPAVIGKVFAQAGILSTFRRRHPGARLARGFDPFETAIATILGQVISVAHTARLMNQLAATYGEEVRHPVSGDRIRLFPKPHILAKSDLHAVAITGLKRAAIREFSARVAGGMIRFDPAQDPDDFKRAVRMVKGIGAWSAEYMALRALGDADAFPSADLILNRFIKAHPRFNVETVRPWRSYAAVCLWNEQATAIREEEANHAAV